MRILIIFLLFTGLAHADDTGAWLDLKGGGEAVGAAQGKATTIGSLEHPTQLSKTLPGLGLINGQKNVWGTGFMISLIENSAQAYNTAHPQTKLYVSSIAKETGGIFPPHSSHQNGLDADILFVGTNHYASVLDSGVVSNRFDPVANWEYWLSLTAQKIPRNGHFIPVVAAILVAPEIKTYLCEWAKNNNHVTTPEDVDLLKRLRPTVGHDTHFHVRLQCSPFHTHCLQPWDPGTSAVTGC